MADGTQDARSVLLFHAEVDDHPTSTGAENPTLYSTFLKSRPENFEVDAISRIVDLQKEFPTLRCHIVHLSAANALPIVRSAKAAGHKLTVETCFHYLCLASDAIPDGRPEFKCCPPIRDDANREALWDALLDGTIDCVVSDHSPCVAELKKRDEGDIMGAWGGISTLGFGLSLLWTEGRKRNLPIGKIVQWMTEKTASHAGLSDRKGKIAVGYDADFVIWDPDVQYTVRFRRFIQMTELEWGFRSRKRHFSSRTNLLHMKGWYSPGEWNRPYFAEIPFTTEFPTHSITWRHREYFCEDRYYWPGGGLLSCVGCEMADRGISMLQIIVVSV